jgi:hypothetical protein
MITEKDPQMRHQLNDEPPLRYGAALWALAGCVVSTARLLWRRRVHLPTEQVGRQLRFADGTSLPATGAPVPLLSGPRIEPAARLTPAPNATTAKASSATLIPETN